MAETNGCMIRGNHLHTSKAKYSAGISWIQSGLVPRTERRRCQTAIPRNVNHLHSFWGWEAVINITDLTSVLFSTTCIGVMCVRACERACERAGVRACVCACVCRNMLDLLSSHTTHIIKLPSFVN